MRRREFITLIGNALAAFSICAVTELRASPDSDGDEPFDMGKLDLARFVARRGPTWREWQKIIANVEAEMRELAKCRTEPDRCNAAERRFETIVKEARSKNGRAKIEFVNERVNGEIRYEPDTAQWGVEDAWSLPIDVNKEGSLNTGVGDCEDYVLAKYAAAAAMGLGPALQEPAGPVMVNLSLTKAMQG